MIHILRLDDGLDVVLQNAREVVLELAASEVSKNLLPVRRGLKLPEVRLQLSRKDLQSSGFADTIGAYQAKHLAWARRRKAMELKGVCAVAMGGFLVQVLGEVDDGDGVKGAFLHADTATDAELFGDKSDLRVRRHLDAHLPHAHYRT